MDANQKPNLNPKWIIALIVLVVAGALILFTLSRSGLPATGANTPIPYTIDTGPAGTGEGNDEGSGEEYGIEVDVSEGQAQLQTPVPMPVATGEPLSPQEVDDIFSRLPALPVSPDEQTEFKYPVILLPPPRPGVTIKESFPPSEFEPTPQVGLTRTAGSPALRPRRGNPDRAVRLHHLQPADGAARHSERPGRGRCARASRPSAARHLALDGNAHPHLRIRLRADRPAAQGNRLYGHRPSWDKIGLGWRPGSKRSRGRSARLRPWSRRFIRRTSRSPCSR